MSDIITVGLDLAKNVFQVHGADGAGRAVCRYVRTLGTLPVNSLIWDGGSIHDERRTRHSTQT